METVFYSPVVTVGLGHVLDRHGRPGPRADQPFGLQFGVELLAVNKAREPSGLLHVRKANLLAGGIEANQTPSLRTTAVDLYVLEDVVGVFFKKASGKRSVTLFMFSATVGWLPLAVNK